MAKGFKKILVRFAGKHVLKLLRRWLLPPGRLLVMGGHGGTIFDDNSRALVEHCATKKEYACVWIYRSPSIKSALRSVGAKPLHADSLRAAIAIRFSEAFFFSHSLNDLVSRPKSFCTNRPVVYLGHGVWGFKRIERRGLGPANTYFSHSICVSDVERNLKASVLDREASAIVPSGLPKHDRILRLSAAQPTSVQKRVLIAPTWRDWLQHSPSSVAVQRFIGNLEELVRAAPQHNPSGHELKLSLMIHKNSSSIGEGLESLADTYGLKIVRPSDDISATLAYSDYLVTDYSSLAWDFLTLERPIARYVFDEHLYAELTGGYPDIASHLDWSSSVRAKDVWSILFHPSTAARVKEVRKRAIPFSDGNSCERLIAAVLER